MTFSDIDSVVWTGDPFVLFLVQYLFRSFGDSTQHYPATHIASFI